MLAITLNIEKGFAISVGRSSVLDSQSAVAPALRVVPASQPAAYDYANEEETPLSSPRNRATPLVI